MHAYLLYLYSSIKQKLVHRATLALILCKCTKSSNRQLLLEPLVTSAELRASEIIWLKENQKKFDEKRLRILTKDLNLIYDDHNLIRCEGRLKNAPLPDETKTPYLINT